jgi:hypothetical protein
MHHFCVLIRNNERIKRVLAFTLSYTYNTAQQFGSFLLGSSSFQVIYFGLLPCSRSIHKLFELNTCLDQIDIFDMKIPLTRSGYTEGTNCGEQTAERTAGDDWLQRCRLHSATK